MLRFTLVAIVCAMLLLVLCQASPVAAADASAIRAVIDQMDAWNRHDMDAFVADTTPDVDWVNIVGMHCEGRETVRRAHAVLLKGIFAHSSLLPPSRSNCEKLRRGSSSPCSSAGLRAPGRCPAARPIPTAAIF